MSSIILIILTICNHFYINDHAVYISVIEINHERSSPSTEISIKVFSDDLENALTNLTGNPTRLSNASLISESRNDIVSYFNQHVLVEVDKSHLELQLKDWEINKDATWFHFTSTCPLEWKNLTIKADLLMELFPTQTNVVQVSHDNVKRYLKLTLDKKEGHITFVD